MDVTVFFSVGTAYQNVAFYTIILLLICLNFELIRHPSKMRKVRSGVRNT